MGIRRQRKHYIIYMGIGILIAGYQLVNSIIKYSNQDQDLSNNQIGILIFFALLTLLFISFSAKLAYDEYVKNKK